MTNSANRWAGKRKPALIALVSPRKKGCQHKGCKEKRPSKLQFAHERQTILSRSGPRGRKEKWADIAKHPHFYKVKCGKHHAQDSKEQHKRLRKLGHR